MRNHFILLLFLLLLLSCQNGESNKIDGSKSVKKTENIENKRKTKPDLLLKYSKIFNVELVGLSKDSIIVDRYYIDFSSGCLCNSPSILLTEAKAYLFGFCKDTLPPISKEPFYTYDITKIEARNIGLSISLENENSEQLSLTFTKSHHSQVYELTVIGAFPNNYIGNRVCRYFTFKPENFEVEDCGDFDG